MEDFASLAHVRWECKYHVIFTKSVSVTLFRPRIVANAEPSRERRVTDTDFASVQLLACTFSTAGAQGKSGPFLGGGACAPLKYFSTFRVFML